MGFSDGDVVAWTRLLYPWGRPLPISDSGFLQDGTIGHRLAVTHAGHLLAELDDPVILVVGESGLGKSDSLRREVDRLQAAGQSAFYTDLRGLDSGDVRDAIGEAISSSDQLHTIAIDGLDQCDGTTPAISRALRSALNDHAGLATRLIFAATSHSPWITQLGDALPSWADKTYTRMAMAPLTQQQVHQAAATDLPNPDEFVTEVLRLGIGPIVAYPMSLRLLLQAARRGELPTSRIDAYRLGIEALLVDAGTAPSSAVTLDQRLAAARRLAMATVLSGTPRVIQRRPPGGTRRDVPLDTVITATISLDALDAVYTSGLLQASATTNWAHRSIEEFLCAEQLLQLPHSTATSLLTHPNAPAEVRPQFVGVAAWLAALDDDWFRWLSERRYDVLFNPDLRQRPDDQRRALAAVLIGKIEDGELPYTADPNSRRYFPDYRGLAYDGLAQDLEPLVAVGQPAWRIREATLIIVGARLHDLDQQLMTLIEAISSTAGSDDYNPDIQAAEWAAIALSDCTDPDLVVRARVVLSDSTTPWPVRLELVRWLWPNHLTTGELRSAVPPADLLAGEATFARRLAGTLTDVETIPADQDSDLLAYLAEGPRHLRAVLANSSPVERLCLQALQTAEVGGDDWQHAVTLTAEHLGDVAMLQWTADDLNDVEPFRRRRFAADVAARSTSILALRNLVRLALVRDDDALWWLNQLTDTANADVQSRDRADHVLRHLSAAITDLADFHRLHDTVAGASVNDQVLREAAEPYFGTAVLGRRTAEAHQPAPASVPPSVPTLAAIIAAAPAGTDPGELLDQIDTLTDDRPTGWTTLSPADQQKLADIADQYLLTATAINRVVTAHRVLDHLAPTRLPAATGAQWLSWLPDLLTAPGAHAAARTAVRASTVFDAVSTEAVILAALTNPATLPIIRGSETFGISQAALQQASDTTIDGYHLQQTLICAAQFLPDDAATLAMNMINGRNDRSSPRAASRGLHAAAALIQMTSLHHRFSELMATMRADTAFATELARISSGHLAWTALTATQLGDLYLWADSTLPQPSFPAPGVPVSSDRAAELAEHLLDLLSNPAEGNTTVEVPAAITVLRDIADRTGNVYIRRRAAMLHDRFLDADFTVTATEVLTVADNSTLRVVTTRDQFASVLQLAMNDLAADLNTDRAMRAQVWHRQRQGGAWSGTWVPMEENEFSTWLCRMLKHYLRQRVALFREVEINPRLASTPADRPDIVAVSLTTETQTINLDIPIEVKCNWHDHVTDAYRTQLVDQYLTGPHGTTGLYVVAYYRGASWASTDRSRKSDAARVKETPQEFADRLRREAAALAPTFTVYVHVFDLVLDD